MADTDNELKLGADSFREMAALALDGGLASCQSCVEFYYFQSHANATAFLDSCAEAGLVEKVSLLRLKALADSDSATAREWYDQSIYISAPAFRKLNSDLARQKIENTANAVYNAFYIYHELLRADVAAIRAAYAKALDESILRNVAVAKERIDVALSSVAQLRLILDGFRSTLRAKNKSLPAAEKLSSVEIEKRATEQTVEYVLTAGREGYRSSRKTKLRDRGEELERFIIDFVLDPFALRKFSREKSRELPEGFHIELLSLIGALCWHRYKNLATKPERAQKFVVKVRNAVDKAQAKWTDDPDYVAALGELAEDLDPEQMPIVPFTRATWLQSGFQSINV